MGYGEEKKNTRQKILKTATDVFLTFCGFFGVYLLAAHMLYQDITVPSMLPYLIGGVVTALILRRIAGATVPEFLWKTGNRRESYRKTVETKASRGSRGDGDTKTDQDSRKAGERKTPRKQRKTAGRSYVMDRETAGRRWLALLALMVCLVFFAWNFKEILRGVLVLADYIVFYYNYVFGTSFKFAVNLSSGEFVTVLGSRQSIYQLSEVQAGAIYVQPSLGANCRTLFGAIGFYSALFKTTYGCKWKTVLPDILFGGAMLAAAFLVGAYETSWMGLCLLIYLVSLLLMFTQGGAESVRRSEREARSFGRTGFKFGRRKNADTKKSKNGRRNKREERKIFLGGKTHVLTVYNAKSASFLAALVIFVAIALGASILLIRKSSYFDSYDTPWIVEKWEQAGDFVNGLSGGSGSASVAAEGEADEDDETETGEGAEDESENGISWEPATGEDDADGTAVTEDLPSDDTVLGTLTLEDEMREASDTTYLKVLIDSGYYLSTDTLYLKCYSGGIYEGDSWRTVTAEDMTSVAADWTEGSFDYMENKLAVETFDLFSRCIEGTAEAAESSELRGLFDIGGMYQIRIQYMGDSSLTFVPYYASPLTWQYGEDGEVREVSTTSYRMTPGGTIVIAENIFGIPNGADEIYAFTIVTYDAAAADFGGRFLYGDGVTRDYLSESGSLDSQAGSFVSDGDDAVQDYMAGIQQSYEELVISDGVYLEVPESLTRLREEFSTVEIGGETYSLADYDAEAGEYLVDDAGLGECIGYVIDYLTENMTYSRSITAVPEDADYIETFLFDRKTGYCSHYASAAVMMFRLFGIPARYAEGFAVDYDSAVLTTGGQYLVNVTGKSAHAWVEIYVDGVGWVAVNVTYGDDTTPGEETSETETTGGEETTAAEMTTTPRTAEEESTAAGGNGDGDADGQSLTAVFAKLSELFRNIGQFLGKTFRVLKTPLLVLLLLELARVVWWLWRTACLRWKCRGKSEEEKFVICTEDLNRYIDRHLHITKRHTMTQREVMEAEGDLFARADGKAGEERKTGWNPFRYRTLESDKHGSGRKTGRRRGPADVIVRMGAQGGKALSAAEYEELLGLIRYAGKKTDETERANLYLTMRKVKLVIYKESPWRRKIFF